MRNRIKKKSACPYKCFENFQRIAKQIKTMVSKKSNFYNLHKNILSSK